MKYKRNGLKAAACLLFAVMLAAAVQTVQAAPRGYYFVYMGEKAVPGASADDFLEAAGEAQKTSRSASCAAKGYDFTYEYEDFILTTYTNSKKKNAKQYVSSIVLTSEAVETPEGIRIGSREKTVRKKYKNAEESFGVYTGTKGKTKIMITIDDKKVSGIEIVQQGQTK